MNSEFQFSLDISRQKYLNYYAGNATTVQVHTNQGLLIQFPASALKPWVTHQGIHGFFSISFDANNKLIELTQLTKFKKM